MVFSSAVFLFLFLPGVLVLYYALPDRFRNAVLLSASLVFYAWGEKAFVLVMLATIVANYVYGLLIARFTGSRRARLMVSLAVATNLAFLIAFKYANFIVDNVNHVLGWIGAAPIHLAPVHLPIGISFFTFQAISYVIDVYRRDVEPQRSLARMALYKSLFPQLIAGPIVRYRDVAHEITRRWIGLSDFADGARRFIIGLGKKVLIANTLAVPSDAIFALPSTELTLGLSWLAVICYSLQLYFDFSGYSDMAIGLGRMFGFHFRENFNFPYVSRSVTEFWRRWHISLSTWFRDYLYIPLGGNRCSPGRTYFNLIITFLLCGLWHGASWNFVLWGAWHGAILVVERLWLGRILSHLWNPARHLYLLGLIMIGWVFFRTGSLRDAFTFLSAMVGGGQGESPEHLIGRYLNAEIWLMLIIGGIASAPVLGVVKTWFGKWQDGTFAAAATLRNAAGLVSVAFHTVVLWLSTLSLASGTHNPFIYFRF
jgi:alginate O-acetyltransferase complex protein AlgI